MCDPRIDVLERRVAELERRFVYVSHWHNTVRSPWYKTLWWFVCGYRVRALGTWYTAPWNRTAAIKYNNELG